MPSPACEASPPDRVREAARLVRGATVAVARTPVWLHGVDTLPPGIDPAGWPADVAVADHAAAAAMPPGIRAHRWPIPADQVTVVDGVPVTTLERTLVDCARMLPRLEALAAADQLLRLRADLDHVRSIADSRRWRDGHMRRLREIVAMADPRSDSPMESWCRCMIVDAELPDPLPQAPVRFPDGSTAYLDLGFEDYRVAAEYDGREHHSDRADRDRDRRRRARIARAGWRMNVFRSEAVIADPAQMLNQLDWELRQRSWSPGRDRLDRTRKRINHIAMQRRLERERKLGVYPGRASSAAEPPPLQPWSPLWPEPCAALGPGAHRLQRDGIRP